MANGGHSGGIRLLRAAAAAAAALGVVMMLIIPGHASADPTTDPAINRFEVTLSSGNHPLLTYLTPGPDSAVWFTYTNCFGCDGLGRVTPDGTVTLFPFPSGWSVSDVAAGAGSLWVPETHGGTAYIGQYATSGSLIREFPVTAAPAIEGIAWGSDGALWFTAGKPGGGSISNGVIGRMTTAGTVTTYNLAAQGGSSPSGEDIVPGPDGALWFDLPTLGAVGRITYSGTVSVIALPGAPAGGYTPDETVAGGPDGAVWEGDFRTRAVRRLTPDGTVTQYTVPSEPLSIAAGSDSHMWFTDAYTVDQMTTDGTVTRVYPLPAQPFGGNPAAQAMTTGPDGKIWMGRQGELDVLDPSVPPPSSGSVGGGLGGAHSTQPPAPETPAASATAEPSPDATATPSPRPKIGSGVATGAHLSPGSNLGLVLGLLAGVALLAGGGVVIWQRRRHPTP